MTWYQQVKLWVRLTVRRFALWLLWLVGEEPLALLPVTPISGIMELRECQDCGGKLRPDVLRNHDGHYRCTGCKVRKFKHGV